MSEKQDREEKVPGQLAVWLVRSLQQEQPDGLPLTNLSMPASEGIHPETGAMRRGS